MNDKTKRAFFAGLGKHYLGQRSPQVGPEDLAKRAVGRADALLAELARTEPTKPVEPQADDEGWIPHKPGDPMPKSLPAIIDFRHADGSAVMAHEKECAFIVFDFWSGPCHVDNYITAWRPAR